MKATRLVWALVLAVVLVGITLALISCAWCICTPAIEFTHVPPYGSFENLQGRARCVEPADYRVAVYIYVSGWWTKPYWAWPLTPIESDGSWTTDITTDGTDQLATKIAAFLVPNGYTPPLMSGGQTLPAELSENAVANAMVERAIFRKIEFSGYTWNVKASETPAGPGPNYFSDRVEDVWVDEDGWLHLRIVQRDGRWYCTEVFTEAPLGYGKYIFHIASRVDQLDKNIVLGLFTWDDTAPERNYREIDIEFARWGQIVNDNAQYVVQPWHHAGNMYRFSMELRGDDSTHGFDWRAGRIFFQSLYGHQPFPGPEEDEIASWTYTGDDIPPAGEGNARINLWLFNGNPPSDGEAAEVIIEAFKFVPQTAAVFRVTREGNVHADSAYYGQRFETGSADVAEWVPVPEPVEPGDVLELDPTSPGQYRKAIGPYSTLVAGVASTEPEPGVVLGTGEDVEGKALLALLGIVPVKVADKGGPIRPGDLLVTSSAPGYAMRWHPENEHPCSFVGKALEPLTDRNGVILVLLMAH